ncbi:hypothetical protein ABFU65_07990 [Xanthomonas campestris pv. raphani]|uniref:hypothetical protein n=1 Tax=Xanthomonas campestris TaxID=339 RepID=UPI00388E7877
MHAWSLVSIILIYNQLLLLSILHEDGREGCRIALGGKGLGVLLQTDFTNGITSQAMQTGGMGVLLTLLILTTPPMAAFFFQGTLGSFMAYSQIGGATSAGGSPGPQGQAPGSYTPSSPARESGPSASSSASSSAPEVRATSPNSGAYSGSNTSSGMMAQAPTSNDMSRSRG